MQNETYTEKLIFVKENRLYKEKTEEDPFISFVIGWGRYWVPIAADESDILRIWEKNTSKDGLYKFIHNKLFLLKEL